MRCFAARFRACWESMPAPEQRFSLCNAFHVTAIERLSRSRAKSHVFSYHVTPKELSEVSRITANTLVKRIRAARVKYRGGYRASAWGIGDSSKPIRHVLRAEESRDVVERSSGGVCHSTTGIWNPSDPHCPCQSPSLLYPAHTIQTQRAKGILEDLDLKVTRSS